MLKCSITKSESRSNYMNLYRAKKTNIEINGLLSGLPLAAAVRHWQLAGEDMVIQRVRSRVARTISMTRAEQMLRV